MGVDAANEILTSLDREIWLITSRAGDRQSGLIATYVSKASLVPSAPRVMVGLANQHFTRELIDASQAFCMHLIDEDRIDWVWHFGIPSGRDIDKLRGQATLEGVTGSPKLTGALAWLECRVETQMNTGDRTIYVAEVVDSGAIRSAPPLTFKRLLELAPPAKLLQMKSSLERDIEVDHNAILDWRRQHPAGSITHDTVRR